MAGVRRGAQAVLKYLAPIFEVSRSSSRSSSQAKGSSASRGWTVSTTRRRSTRIAVLGSSSTFPGALLLLIVALLAWHPDRRVRLVSIILPFDLFVQSVLANTGRWPGRFTH